MGVATALADQYKQDGYMSVFSNPMQVPAGLEALVSSFRRHSLKDLDKCELMNRVDTKFLVPIHLLSDVLDAIKPHCSSLQINERQIFEYFTTYYDREDLHHYFCHHNGKLNRHKIRCRTYVDSATHFLEVKFKNNKKRTLKTRISLSSDEKDNALKRNIEFLAKQGVPVPGQLAPVQHCSYRRLAFAGNDLQERLTLDFNMCFRNASQSEEVVLPAFFVLELKQGRLSRLSKLYQALRSLQLRPSSFSKYCMGMSMLHEGTLKRNNFNRIHRDVEKLRSIYDIRNHSN